MRIETLGDGDPEVAVVGGIHGDEPCGVRAVERLAEVAPEVTRPVALVVANEAAVQADTRYVDTDLNRAFPGDHDGEAHETRLAARLADAVGDCLTLALHSTQSYGRPFALVEELGPVERDVCSQLTVDSVVETIAFSEGRVFASIPETIEVECGYQKSEAAAQNATMLVREFLAAADALHPDADLSDLPDGPAAEDHDAPASRDPDGSLPVFRLRESLPKQEGRTHEVFVPNFERVAAGERYAATDEREVVADEAFYPVLMSAYGYEDVYGYAADRRADIEP